MPTLALFGANCSSSPLVMRGCRSSRPRPERKRLPGRSRAWRALARVWRPAASSWPEA